MYPKIPLGGTTVSFAIIRRHFSIFIPHLESRFVPIAQTNSCDCENVLKHEELVECGGAVNREAEAVAAWR